MDCIIQGGTPGAKSKGRWPASPDLKLVSTNGSEGLTDSPVVFPTFTRQKNKQTNKRLEWQKMQTTV